MEGFPSMPFPVWSWLGLGYFSLLSTLCGLLLMSLEPQGTYTEVPTKCTCPHFHPFLVRVWASFQAAGASGSQPGWAQMCALVLSRNKPSHQQTSQILAQPS